MRGKEHMEHSDYFIYIYQRILCFTKYHTLIMKSAILIISKSEVHFLFSLKAHVF